MIVRIPNYCKANKVLKMGKEDFDSKELNMFE